MYANPFVTATYTTVPTGWNVDFVLNADQNLGILYWIALNNTSTAVLSPNEWTIETNSRGIVWLPVGSNTVAPGGTLMGCSAILPYLPSQIPYYIRQSDNTMYYGVITTPEPSSIICLVVGCCGLVGLKLRKSSK